MENLKINALQLDYLKPLLKWRIVDLESLRLISGYCKSYYGFYYLIRKFESQGILKSFKDPRNIKKYLYLSDLGERILNRNGNPLCVSDLTLSHDSKVSELVREFLKGDFFDSGELEHELVNKRNFRNNPSHIPDGIISGVTAKGRIRIAIELELSSKSKRRMREKVEFYFDSSYYDYVFFVFPNRSFLGAYERVMELFPCSKAHLVYLPSIFFRRIELGEGEFWVGAEKFGIEGVIGEMGLKRVTKRLNGFEKGGINSS